MTRKKHPDDKADTRIFDFTHEDENKELCGSEDEIKENETVMNKVTKKRSAADFEEGEEVKAAPFAVGRHDVTDISKVMHAKKKRLVCLTNNYMKGSQQKLEQLWKSSHSERQKMTEQYSQQVYSTLDQWENEAQRAAEEEEKFNNLFRQQIKVLQQARVMQKQKLKTVKQLYEQFIKNIEDMEKSHQSFLDGAQQELKKEMAILQKKILMDMQQQEMATVRKSLHSMLF
ncbi:synaptonemal complex protein 3 [Pholidichthys leucotaenia]